VTILEEVIRSGVSCFCLFQDCHCLILSPHYFHMTKQVKDQESPHKSYDASKTACLHACRPACQLGSLSDSFTCLYYSVIIFKPREPFYTHLKQAGGQTSFSTRRVARRASSPITQQADRSTDTGNPNNMHMRIFLTHQPVNQSCHARL
jgi:hypothetical protein